MSAEVASRRPRISDAAMTERMLDAATALVARSGLAVSIDHLVIEDVIAAADVGRSAVYRHWPTKDRFLDDVLLHLASGSAPDLALDPPHAAELLRAVLQSSTPRWRRPDGRRRVLAEILRALVAADLAAVLQSPAWQTHLAISAAAQGISSGERRTEIQRALADAEDRFIDTIAGTYGRLCDALGLRLRQPATVSFADLAQLGSAAIRGTVVRAQITPSLISQTVLATPHDGLPKQHWTLPGLALASVFLAAVEDDPERSPSGIPAVRATLQAHGLC